MPTVIPVKYYNTYVLKNISLRNLAPFNNWYIEESRIRGGYNNVQTGLAPRAFAYSEENNRETLSNGLIYSGIFNSRTGINQSNVFSVGDQITKKVDPGKGSVQRLYAEDTNLVIFQERKVNRALIDKDAIYTQEGQPVQTASNVVIGGIQPYAGEFGISRNPESFAVYGYQKYFADADKGSILRLSIDGITEISNYGMVDYFRDNLAIVGSGNILGGWDIHNKCYTLSMVPTSGQANTLSFDEAINGWTSRYSYIPNNIFSIRNNFYTTSGGGIYQHYSTQVNRGYFYDTQSASTITTIFNTSPSVSKNFKTINYEGNGDWQLSNMVTGTDSALPITPFVMPTTLAQLDNQYLQNQFSKKENKYFANLINSSPATQGEIIFGGSISGIKGFTATALLLTANSGGYSNNSELFAVSSDFIESSY